MRTTEQILAPALFVATLLAGQPPASSADFTGYVQSSVVAPETDGRGGGASWFNEVRIAVGNEFGPLRLDTAYELGVHRATPDSGDGTDWLNLQGTLSRGDRGQSRHRVDRLQLSWSTEGGIDAIVGRQAISWGTTAYLTPADPFAPFALSDTFREYRRGIDSIRLRAYPSALSEIDLVLRPSRLRARKELTALARALTTWGDWEVSAWGGALYGDAAAALGAAGEAGNWTLRFEASFRDTGGSTPARGTLGAYRTFQVEGRSLGLALEYQHDGLGAAGSGDVADLLHSDPYRRGELQALGRSQVLARVAYQIHPLWDIAGLALWNMNAGSVVVAPGFSYSVSDEATLTGGAAASIGDQIPEEALPEDARGNRDSVTAHLSLTWYF